MVQMFHPSRIVCAFVLSVVLVLNAAQLTQAKTTQLPAYPSRAKMEDAIAYYYNIIGPFGGKNVMGIIDSITSGPLYGTGTFNRFGACVQYHFTSGPSYKVQQTARHIFTFQYDADRYPTNPWIVIRMDLNAC